VKGATATFYGHTQRNLVGFFGADKLMREVTPGNADEFRLWLLRPKSPVGQGGEGLSDNTVRRRCTLASQFFHAAVRKGLITNNPFEGVGGSVKANKARMHFISREDAIKVDEACPDAEWRLIFALSRFGGLRTPSEHYGLCWGDVDWSRNRFLVHSPKTEHHEGGESRWVPIFPELRLHLEATWDTAVKIEPEATPAEKKAASFVIQRYRNQANLRTRFNKIIKRAGLRPWAKLFQNLRSTRQTELAQSYPIHVVCAWLGNKAAVAAEHYLQITDADFERAAQAVCISCAASHENEESRGNAANASDSESPKNTGDSQSLLGFPTVQFGLVGGEGLEPATSTV
jgi:integrase